MKIIVTGATGMVGSEVIRQALSDTEITEVTAIVRKPINITHPKLKTVLHQDFLDYSNLRDVFKNNDACIWCLGISQNAVDESKYIVITYDYTLAAAREMLSSNPSLHFLFLSGDGAASDEKSRFLFGRIKGRTENALFKLPFKKLYLARPGGIKPMHPLPGISFFSKIIYGLVGFTGILIPSLVIKSTDLAKALIFLVKHGSNNQIISHKDLKEIATRLNHQSHSS